METVAESYRGLSFLVGVSLDRFLVPVAVVVALLGAALIGVELAEIFGADPAQINRL